MFQKNKSFAIFAFFPYILSFEPFFRFPVIQFYYILCGFPPYNLAALDAQPHAFAAIFAEIHANRIQS